MIAHKAAKKSGKKKESKVIEYKQEDANNVQVETFLHENEFSENCFREISRKPLMQQLIAQKTCKIF